MAEIEEPLDVSSSPFLLSLSARLTRSQQGVHEISYFDIDLKNNTIMVLWTHNLELLKIVLKLFTTFIAIGRQFPWLHFSHRRVTVVLAPV